MTSVPTSITRTDCAGHGEALVGLRDADTAFGGQRDVDDRGIVVRVGQHEVLDAAVEGVAGGEVPRRCAGVGTGGDGLAGGIGRRVCSTSPPPPSISTNAAAYGESTIASTSIATESYGGTSMSRVCASLVDAETR